MIILKNTLKRLLRNKVSLLLVLVIPPAMLGFLFGLGSLGVNTVTVGLVDQDQTPLTRQLEEVLQEQAAVKRLSEEDIRGELAATRVQLVLVIPAGFTETILVGGEPEPESYSIQESNLSLPLRLVAESFIRAARNVAVAADGNPETFYRGMEDYRSGRLRAETRFMDGLDGNQSSAAASAMGILGINMLFLALYATMHLLKDRENRTFHRVMTAPLSQGSYLLQIIGCFLAILMIQMTGVFFISRFLLNLYLGESTLALYGVMGVFALVCVAFSIAISSLVKTTRQAGTLASLLTTPMAMLGGLLWPREIMPEILQHIGMFLPTTWMMDAANKVIVSGRFLDAGWEVAILFLFALVFFLLGSWRRVDIAA